MDNNFDKIATNEAIIVKFQKDCEQFTNLVDINNDLDKTKCNVLETVYNKTNGKMDKEDITHLTIYYTLLFEQKYTDAINYLTNSIMK